MTSVPEKRGDARRETGDYMIACSVSSLAAGITIKPIGQGRHLPSHLYPLTAFNYRLTAFIYRLPSYVSPQLRDLSPQPPLPEGKGEKTRRPGNDD